MPDSSDYRLDKTLDQLDLTERELPREHGQVLNLHALRRHLAHASGQHPAPPFPRATDTRPADTDTQLEHALNLAFADLGGAAFALAHHGALNDKRLAPHVQRIHELYTQLDALAHTTPIRQADHNTPAEHAATA